MTETKKNEYERNVHRSWKRMREDTYLVVGLAEISWTNPYPTRLPIGSGGGKPKPNTQPPTKTDAPTQAPNTASSGKPATNKPGGKEGGGGSTSGKKVNENYFRFRLSLSYEFRAFRIWEQFIIFAARKT